MQSKPWFLMCVAICLVVGLALPDYWWITLPVLAVTAIAVTVRRVLTWSREKDARRRRHERRTMPLFSTDFYQSSPSVLSPFGVAMVFAIGIAVLIFIWIQL